MYRRLFVRERDRSTRVSTGEAGSLPKIIPLVLILGLCVILAGCGPGTTPYVTLQISVTGEGSVDPAPGTYKYRSGTRVTLKAIPHEGWAFSRWEGDATGNDNPINITMDGDKTVKAVFAPVSASVPFLELGGGTTVDVSGFNGANYVYTMITAQPATKPESNDSPSTRYSFTLTTTAGTDSYIAPHRASFAGDRKMPYTGLPSYQGQAELDEKLRNGENSVLRNRARQVSRQTAAKAPPSNPTLGASWDNVYIVVTEKYISTTCQYISDHAYFFVDNRDTEAMKPVLASYGTAFDAIYDINHSHFGMENDVDGNGKVIIIFSRELESMQGLLGYFFAVDKFPKSYFAESNEGDIFYMTTYADYQGDIIKGTLAHEFQHMIYFDEHYDRDVISTYTWLNEALSQAAEYYNGYNDNHLGWIRYFLKSNWDGLSLTHWTSSNYGYGAAFIRYLIDQYGDAAIRDMCATDLVGVAAVEAATGADFNTIFNNFIRALVMSGTGDSSDPRYNFITLDLQAVQPDGRGGLITDYKYDAGTILDGSNLYPYQLFFAQWTGTFGTMNLAGDSMAGTVFGLSK